MGVNLDWQVLDDSVNTKKTKYDFDTFGHLFKKVAFDQYKPINGMSTQLWELRKADDGREYLFALYDEGEDIIATSSLEKPWEATPDSSGSNITLSYKSVPIYRFAASEYKFSPQDSQNFADFVREKAQSKEWVGELLSNAMTEERRTAVLKLIQGD